MKFKTLSLVWISLLLASCDPTSLLPSSSSQSELSSSSFIESSSLETPSTSSSSMLDSSSSDQPVSTSETLSEASSSLASSTSQPSSATYTYSGYYASIDGLNDEALLPSLRTLLRSILVNDLFPSGKNYGEARYVLQNSDRDPNNANNLIAVYSLPSVKATWDEGKTWDREHVWPQSLMGVSTSNTSRHKGADIHNLKPAIPNENSSRGNRIYYSTNTSYTYVPPVSIRGDLARILFYMTTMYPELSLVDTVPTSSTEFDAYQMKMGQFSLLVSWHLADPVDSFERNRNDVLANYQGNRNPYIDHEELVCRVFRNQTQASLNACQPS